MIERVAGILATWGTLLSYPGRLAEPTGHKDHRARRGDPTHLAAPSNLTVHRARPAYRDSRLAGEVVGSVADGERFALVLRMVVRMSLYPARSTHRDQNSYSKNHGGDCGIRTRDGGFADPFGLVFGALTSARAEFDSARPLTTGDDAQRLANSGNDGGSGSRARSMASAACRGTEGAACPR